MKILFSAVFLMAFALPTGFGKIDIKSKIFVERVADKRLTITNVNSNALSELENDSDLFMTIALNYEVDSDVGFDEEKSEQSIAKTRAFFYNNNMAFVEDNNIDADEIFISSYTPFVFCKYENESANSIYSKATQIANSMSVSSIHIGDESAYKFESAPVSILNATEMQVQSTAGRLPKYLRSEQDNYPDTQLSLTGNDVKVGILDKGKMETDDLYIKSSEIYINDNVTSNDSNLDPTITASIIVASNGIAPNASIHFVDAANRSGLNAIEDLADMDIICIGVVHINPVAGGSYNVSSDLYIDYFYQTTKIVMVAGAGDTNEYEDLGYVPCPASASNVITVGSINYDGVPSKFSSYKNLSNADDGYDYDKPHISAIGEKRLYPDMRRGVSCTGTKFSAAAVAGTLALLKEKHGANLDYTSAVMILEMTADYTKIDLSEKIIPLYSHDINDSNGNGDTNEYLLLGQTQVVTNTKKGLSNLRIRTGAGALDIQNAIENLEFPITSESRNFGSNARYTLPKSYNLKVDDMIEVAFAAQKYVIKETFLGITLITVYHAYFDIDFEIWSGNTRVGIYTMISGTTNMGRHIVMQPGTFTVVIEAEPMALQLMHHFNYGVNITIA